ncbi:polysaccharide biosynthesis/export family protein [Tabrizicola soli]|uniref:Polysaccharide biosynthesis/export family protein n=1 Tax=Tabrizicola soli TaxID=2185115 RepID=A0ABV7DR83_9RHOB|nr:polysaccharide biosynthesis/export family protein [Tabrizicola soli]
MRFVLALIAALLVIPFLADPGLAQDYRLRPGDTVQVEVLEDTTLNRSAMVLPDGQISLPLTGSVRAAGRTLAQIQADLATRLAPNFAEPPTVFVTLASLAERVTAPARTIDIFILGAANTPGRVEVPPGTTVLQAIAAAGGLSPFAATKRLQLRRIDKSGSENIYRIDFDAIERGASNTTRLVDGDVIVVPQRRLFE